MINQKMVQNFCSFVLQLKLINYLQTNTYFITNMVSLYPIHV